MRTVLAPILLVLAGCGVVIGGVDPCRVPVGDVDVSPATTSITATRLECDPASDAYTCGPDVAVSRVQCADGFGFAISSETTTVLLRLASDGSAWKAGGQLARGEVLDGALAMTGMPSPAEPVPPAGREQRGRFVLTGAAGSFSGSFITTW